MTERKGRKEGKGEERELGYPAICHRNVEPSYISGGRTIAAPDSKGRRGDKKRLRGKEAPSAFAEPFMYPSPSFRSS